MHCAYPEKSLEVLCGLFGYTRQSYYKRGWQTEKRSFENRIILDLVDEQRECIPGLGGKKLYHMLKQELSGYGIKIGRDRFFSVLRLNDRLIKRRKKYAQTTMSKHYLKKHPNRIIGLVIEEANRLWVSDITYIKVGTQWNYVIFITDAYSRKVIGHQVADRAHTSFCLAALQQALSQWVIREKDLIHHSDRGLQYCSYTYTGLLEQNDILISMTQNGDPLENAIAERVNGIFKQDFCMDKTFDALEQAKEQIQQMVYHYNHTRPHASCDYLTPAEAHQRTGLLPRRW